MNTRNIVAVLADRGLPARTKFGEAGPEVGIKLPGRDKWLVGTVPIDDESDMRFCDFMESQYRQCVNDHLIRTSRLSDAEIDRYYGTLSDPLTRPEPLTETQLPATPPSSV